MEQNRILNELRAEAEVLTRMHRDISQSVRDQDTDSFSPYLQKSPNFLQQPEQPQDALFRLKEERRQLVEWGESLYKEVQALERNRIHLENQLESAKSQNVGLENKNQHLSDKVSSLQDSLAQIQTPDDKAIVERSVQSGHEVADLRRQLEAYAVEIDKARAERDKATKAQKEAEHDIKRSNDRQEPLVGHHADLIKENEELKAHNTRINQFLNVERSMKESFQEELKDAHVELDVIGASLKLAREENMTLHQDLAASKRELRSAHPGETVVMAQAAAPVVVHQTLTDDKAASQLDAHRKLVARMQLAFAEQTRDYETVIEEIKGKAAAAMEDNKKNGKDLEVLPAEFAKLSSEVSDIRKIYLEYGKNVYEGAGSREPQVTYVEAPQNTGVEELKAQHVIELIEVRQEADARANSKIKALSAQMEEDTKELNDELKTTKIYLRKAKHHLRRSASRNCVKELKTIFQGTIVDKACFKPKNHKKVKRFIKVLSDFWVSKLYRWTMAFCVGAKT
eukprot:Platyproteum_vivax@DN5332_c0_g1_i1.p1